MEGNSKEAKNTHPASVTRNTEVVRLRRKPRDSFHLENGMNKAAFLRLMDSYCGRARAYMQDDRLLCGAALAVRKSLELMGAALLSYDEKGKPVRSRVIEGVEVRPRLRKAQGAQAAALRSDYSMICDGEQGVNRILHYQGYRALIEKRGAGHRSLIQAEKMQRETLLDEAERRMLLEEHYSMRQILAHWHRAVFRFMSAFPLIDEAECEAYPQLKQTMKAGERLYDGQPESGVLCYAFALEDVSRRIASYYKSNPKAMPDQWISWCCSILHEVQEHAYTELASADTMQVMLRKMCERMLLRRLCRLDMKAFSERLLAGAKKEEQGQYEDNATLEMYIQAMLEAGKARIETEPEVSQRCRDVSGVAGCIRQNSYAFMHWRADEKAEPSGLQELQDFRAALDRQLNFGSLMVSYAICDQRPVYAWKWIRANRAQWDELQETICEMAAALEGERKRTKRWRLAAILLTAFIAAAAVAVGCFMTVSIIPSGEIRYTVMIGDETLTPGQTYAVRGDEEILFRAVGGDVNVTVTGYYFNDDPVQDKQDNMLHAQVPYGSEGEEIVFHAAASGRKTSDDMIVQGKWQDYPLRYTDAVEGISQQESAEPDAPVQTTMDVSFAGGMLSDGERILVRPGDVIDVSAYSDAGIAFIGMYTVIDGMRSGILDYPSDTAAYVCPGNETGTDIHLFIEAVGSNDTGEPNTVTKTGWMEVVLCYDTPENRGRFLSARLPGKALQAGDHTTAWAGAEITVQAMKSSILGGLRYSWDGQEAIAEETDTLFVTIPESLAAGETHTLDVAAYDKAGEELARVQYLFDIIVPGELTMEVSYEGMLLPEDTEILVKPGDVISARAWADAGIYSIGWYSMHAGEEIPPYEDTMTDTLEFVCPEDEPGALLYLYIEAVSNEDPGYGNTVTKTGWRCFRLRYR